jgi:Na+-translocating ferredoxin:NAD+ oxidoreductase subunit B
MAVDVYEELAAHLDEALSGVPASPTLMKILEILYPGEEAEVALKLTFFDNKTAAQWKELVPDKADRLEEILDGMARRGTVFTERKPGQERIYRLLPSIVGFTETPFFAGKDTEMTRALAPLWVEYVQGEFGGELARGVPLVRVIPISESLQDASEVLPYDALEEKIGGVSFMAVSMCPCRQMRRYTGGGCEHSLENCLHFGSMARYLVEQGMARQITRDETLKILREATEEGLVHISDNVQGSLTTICNCCSDCCAFITTKLLSGRESLARSNYVAAVEAEACVGCATCEERCPMDAVAVVDDVAVVDPALCIGCGVCTPSCGGDSAIALVVRDEIAPPPELPEFVTARLKK